MHSFVEDLSSTKKRITIEATADEIEEEILKALDDLRVRTKLPGFRPGKVPIALLEKKFGKDVEKNVFEKLIPQYYSNAIKEARLVPLAHPVFEKSDYQRKSDFKIVCSVEVRPVIEDLNYEDIPLKKREVTVKEEEVEMNLENLLKSKSTYEPVDRAVKKDDLIVIDYDVIQDNETYSDQFLKVGSDSFPENFFDPLIGKNKGDTVEVQVSFPDDYGKKEFRERTLDFKVHIKDIKELVIPELDDEFAKDVGLDTLPELKKKVKEGLEASKKDGAIKAQKEELIKALIERYDFELPESILNAELKTLVSEAKGKEQSKDKSEEELEEEFRNEAIQNVKAMILLDTIGEKENITVSDDELRQRLMMLSRMMNMTPEALMQIYVSRYGSLEGLRHTIYREKVADILYTKAKIQKGE